MNKRFLFAIIFLLAGLTTFAQYTVQSKYFVYLQTEPAQPFYIRINGQKIDANSSGYLILPQLKDGDYRLIVGFQDNKFPEMTYKFKVDSKDKGYLIKNFGSEGWSLFDLQTMDVQKPLSANEAAVLAKTEEPKPRPQPRREEPKPAPKPQETAPVAVQNTPQPTPDETTPSSNVSDFTKVLSQATNDKSILEEPKPVAKAEEPRPVPKNDVAQNTNAANDNFVVEEKPPIPQEAQPAANVKPGKGAVVKLSQNDSNTGTVVIYEDRSTGGKAEQIEITIPSEEEAAAPRDDNPVVEEAAPAPESTASGNGNFVVEEKPAIPQESKVEKKSNKKKKGGSEETANTGGCKAVAGENDFLNLRRTMASKDNDDKMITEARRAFKSKCYSTAQLKYISSMFLSNAGKYNFFEAARGHVSDPENFSSLQTELKDNYYIDKFNSLK